MTSLAALLFPCVVAVTSGQPTVDLKTGAVTGSVSSANGLQWVVQPPPSPSNTVCNLRGVLKLTFDSSTRRRARLLMSFSSNPTGWTFDIGDSQTNDGYAGDGSSQSNDAEVHSIGRTIFFQGKDNPSGGSYGLLYSQDNFLSSNVTLEVKDELCTAYSGGNFIYVDSPKLFALRGQADNEGPVNNDVYLALNQVVTGRFDREGTGLCSVSITWLSS